MMGREALHRAHQNAGRLTRLLNSSLETEHELQVSLIRELFGHLGEKCYVKPPFHCDFGCNTSIGNRFFSNYGCVFLDWHPITIGDRVLLGPKVGIYATQQPVTIGSHVWIGGRSTLCGGVTVGSNVVIGAGSVVREDIPDNVLAAGNPCRVIRPITEEDKAYWNQQLDLYRQCCDAPLV